MKCNTNWNSRLSGLLLGLLFICNGNAADSSEITSPEKWPSGSFAEKILRDKSIAVYAFTNVGANIAHFDFANSILGNATDDTIKLLLRVMRAGKWDPSLPNSAKVSQAMVDAYVRASPGNSAVDLLVPAYGSSIAQAALSRIAPGAAAAKPEIARRFATLDGNLTVANELQ